MERTLEKESEDKSATFRDEKLSAACAKSVGASSRAVLVGHFGPAPPRTAQSGPFVNAGLRRWELGRANWIESGALFDRDSRRPPPVVDDEVIYDTIFSKPMGWQLPNPVPLAHMVELLEDEWSD